MGKWDVVAAAGVHSFRATLVVVVPPLAVVCCRFVFAAAGSIGEMQQQATVLLKLLQ